MSRWPQVALLSQLGQGLKLFPRPVEAYSIFNYLTDSMFTQRRHLTAADAAPDVIGRYRNYVKKILFYQNKPRFVQKHTGYPRLNYLSAIFPDARFIHVVRDGRAVANSMLHVSWWDGTMKSWWWGPMKTAYQQEYIAANQEPLVLAAIVWKTLMDLVEEERTADFPRPFLEVRYEELIQNTNEVLERVLDFCNLPDSSVFKKRISAIPIHTGKKLDFDGQRMKLLESCLGEHLARYGYTA